MNERPQCEICATGPEGLIIVFQPQVYRLSAVKKAAYKFADRFHVHVKSMEDSSAKVVLKAKAPLVDSLSAAGEFCNEVLDQDLRETIAQETEAVRNLLLAQAFSATSLIDAHRETGNCNADPLGIREKQSDCSA